MINPIFFNEMNLGQMTSLYLGQTLVMVKPCDLLIFVNTKYWVTPIAIPPTFVIQ